MKKDWKKYWSERKIDWKTAYFDTWSHAHRGFILAELHKFYFGSILEVGCASGPNLYAIHKAFPEVRLGGCDLNKDAINLAKQMLPPESVFDVCNAEDLFFSDKSTDIVLTDACLIYQKDIRKVLKEIKRVGRKHVLFVEFHSENPLKRFMLKIASGYYSYNYLSLLEEVGYYDIKIKKLPDLWKGEPWKTFGHLITANI